MTRIWYENNDFFLKPTSPCKVESYKYWIISFLSIQGICRGEVDGTCTDECEAECFCYKLMGGHMKVRCNHRVLFSHKMGGWMNCLQGILHNFQIWIAFVTLYIKSSRVNELDQWTSTHKDQNVVTISK